MSIKISFTNKRLERIEPPLSGRDVYRDLGEKGLIMMVGYGKNKVFYLYKKIGSKPRRVRIGSFPDISVSDARAFAAKLKTEIARNSIFLGCSSSKMNFKQLFDKFIKDYARNYKKTWQQDVNMMDRYGTTLYSSKVSFIDQHMLQELFNKVSLNHGKVTANRFMSLLNTVFNYAVKWDIIVLNPAINIRKHKEKSRDRFLTSEELPRFFESVDLESNEDVRDFILMLLYTGARKSNVLAMQWSSINFEDKTWYIADTKNGESHLVPLINQAMKILEQRKLDAVSDYVFHSDVSSSGYIAAPKNAWKRILERANIKDFCLHDLRRTMGSLMAQTGSNAYVIGKALNHKSQRSTAIYARVDTNSVRQSMSKAALLFTRE